MAISNISVTLPARDTAEERAADITAAFAAASGLAPDENGMFWLNDSKTLGVGAAVSTTGYMYAVNGAGASLAITTNISYNAESAFVYNTSTDGDVFAFALATINNTTRLLSSAIATDEAGNALVIGYNSATSFKLLSEDNSVIFPVVGPALGTSIVLTSMVRMPTFVRATAFSGLYQILGTPSASWTGETGIYVNGSLYKIIAPGSGTGALAFKV